MFALKVHHQREATGLPFHLRLWRATDARCAAGQRVTFVFRSLYL